MDFTAILNIAKAIGGLLGTLAFAFWTYGKLRERAMMKRYNIKANPTRCGEMIARVEALEKALEHNREDHGKLFQQIGALAVEIARIGRNGGARP
jgi:hypothetical protein